MNSEDTPESVNINSGAAKPLDGLRGITFDQIRKDNPGLFQGGGGTIVMIANPDFDVWSEVFENRLSHVISKCGRDYPHFPAGMQSSIAEIHSKCWLTTYAFNKITQPIPGGVNPQWMIETMGSSSKAVESILTSTKAKETIRFVVEARFLLFYVETFLIQIKSALDLYFPIVAGKLKCKDTIRGFNKKGTDAGGRFLDALRNNIPIDSRPDADILIEIITRHKFEWLDQAIQMRDKVTHHQSFNSELRLEGEVIKNDSMPLLTLNIIYEGTSLIDLVIKFKKGFESLIKESVFILRRG